MSGLSISMPNVFAAAAFLFSIASGWIALYLLFWLFPTRPLVPKPIPSTSASTADTSYEPPRTFWTMSFPTLRVSTTRFTRFLSLPRHVRWVARAFYLVGALLTLTYIGFLGARLVLEGMSVLVDTSGWVSEMGDLPADVAAEEGDLFGDFDAPPFLTIPGINLPSSLWRPFLIAVFGSLLFHELGHSLAASAWNLPTHSISLYLHLIFPSASVNFATARLQAAPPLARLAIASAGIWHNMLLAILCMSLIARPWLWLSLSGFAEVPGDLRGVLVISADAPLDSILPPYSRLVAVNDHPVSSSHDLAQIALEVVPPLRQCLSPSVFPMPSEASDPHASYPLAPCCLPRAGSSSYDDAQDAQLCFFHPTTLASACIPPHSVSPFQCASDRDCPVGFCMASHLPHDPRARLLDLNITLPGADHQVRVLWMGDPSELARRVRVGRVVATAARGVLPDWWPYVVVAVLELTVQASLSLAVVNAVPVGALDGAELVVAVVAVVVRAWRAVTGGESVDQGEGQEGLDGRRDEGRGGGGGEATGAVRPARPKLRPRYLSNNFGGGRPVDASGRGPEPVPLDRRDTLPLDSIPFDRADTLLLSQANTLPFERADTLPLSQADTLPFHRLDTLPLSQTDTIPLDRLGTPPLAPLDRRADTLPLPDAESQVDGAAHAHCSHCCEPTGMAPHTLRSSILAAAKEWRQVSR